MFSQPTTIDRRHFCPVEHCVQRRRKPIFFPCYLSVHTI